MKPFYITTTIPYVNAEPHVGFALEVVQADSLARHKRHTGYEVFYNAGTDEHGQKIYEKALEAGEDVTKYVDRHADSVKALKKMLNLSYDNFVRTTDDDHMRAAQSLWELCDKAGDIYKKKYRGLYCVGCEKFLQQRDLVDGKCPLHPGQDPVELEEENYFFKLSNYQTFLEEYLNHESVIIPEHRKQEAQNFVKAGLEDFSISREKEKLPWGVPVPGDDGQVMYVWFDALTNYISTLGWPDDKSGNYKKFWEEGFRLQMAGKDQIRFQSIMWPAMLKSAGLPAPEQVFYHGFINSGGQRMSKSLGNFIKPGEMVEKYGTDATRYLLLRHVHPTDDTDITWERLDEWYNAHLANGLGNLVARILKMSETHLPAPIPDVPVQEFDKEYLSALGRYDFAAALDVVWKKVGELDEKITETEPFKLVKTNPEKAKEIITELATELYIVGRMLFSFMPETNVLIKDSVKANKKPDTLFARID